MDRNGVVLGHITDAHIAPRSPSTTVLKRQSVAILEDLLAQFRERSVDLVMFGGDNIDNRGHGPADLAAFVELASTADRSVCILGNHEVSWPSPGRVTAEEFAHAVAGRGISPGRYNFVETVGNVRVIGVDTTLIGSSGGYVSPASMRFLAHALREGDEEHVVVLGHHLLYPAWSPLSLTSWDRDYLVANREHVTSLLASCTRVRAYLCGHHHASRIQRIMSRGHTGGFYHVVTASPAAYPHHGRLLRFAPDGIHVSVSTPRIPGLVEVGRQAVLQGRKARRYGTLGAATPFLHYVGGQASDNNVVLPYDAAPKAQHRGVSVSVRQSA